MKKIDIYTDGACSGNPGPGGWGALLFYNNQKKILKGFLAKTTNNIMEMTAVVESLKALKEPCEVVIYSDSKYVIDGATKWLFNWKRNGWKNSQKQEVKNKDLWVDLDSLLVKNSVEFVWIKGHNNNEFNEECDTIAREMIKNNLK